MLHEDESASGRLQNSVVLTGSGSGVAMRSSMLASDDGAAPSDLAKSFEVSQKVQGILEVLDKLEFADAGAFVAVASKSAEGAAIVLKGYAEVSWSPQPPTKTSAVDPRTSEGLIDAFKDATAIRRRTGGKDTSSLGFVMFCLLY
jgi:hypothetical protein